MLAALVTALLAIFFVSLFTGLRIARLNRDNNELMAEVTQLRARLAELEPLYEKLRVGLAEILGDKVPHLRPLELDTAMEVKNAYVKSILFTEARSGDKHHYEYTLLIENTTGFTVKPHVEVLVFDELGVQVGHATDVLNENLQPEDSRSRAGEVTLMRQGEPAYFEVRVHMPEILREVVENNGGDL